MSGIIQVLNSKKYIKVFNIHGCTNNIVVE